MIFRIYYQQRGGHTHCRMFAGPSEGSLGMCGNFTLRNEEFAEYRKRFAFDFRPEAV